MVESTAKGKRAGKTFSAHTVSPSKKLCMKVDGADKNVAATVMKSRVMAIFRYFTQLVYSQQG